MQCSVKDKLKLFLKHLNIGQSAFQKSVGSSNRYINNIRKLMQPDKVQSIALKYPQLNISWLITDTGDMLNEQDEYKNESNTSEEKGQNPHYEDTNYKPRPNIDAFYGALGVPNGFTLAVRVDECEQLSIPFISNCDFSIKGRSDSMINRKNPDRSICEGDLIACRIWTGRSYIKWG